MSEPSVSFLVRDLAQETSGWLEAEVVHLRRELDERIDEVRVASVRLAVGIVFAALGVQLLLAALVAWLAIDLRLGWAASLGIVGAVVTLIAIRAGVAARGAAPERHLARGRR